ELLFRRSVDRDARVIARAVFDLLTVDIDVDQPARPIDLSHRIRRDQHPLSGPPVPGVDFDVTDAPVGIVHEEVLDMTDPTVAGTDLVPRDSCDAAKMRVALFGLGVGTSRTTCFPIGWCHERGRHPTFHWEIAASPIRIPTIRLVDAGLDLPRYRLIRIDIRAVLDLLHGQFDGEVAQRPIGMP